MVNDRMRADSQYAGVDFQIGVEGYFPKQGVLAYLVDAKRTIDRASTKGAMNAVGLSIFAGALAVLLDLGYRGEGNGGELSVEQLAELAEKLSGRRPDETELDDARTAFKRK
jgi:hypothetical protein